MRSSRPRPLTRMGSAAAALALSLALGGLGPLAAPAQAQEPSAASELSGLSALPLASVTAVASVGSAAAASVVIAPAVLLSATGQLLLVAAEASADGTVWLLERASDGARVVARFAGDTRRLATIHSGRAVTVVPVAAGWLLAADGTVLAYVPRDEQARLLYDQRIR